MTVDREERHRLLPDSREVTFRSDSHFSLFNSDGDCSDKGFEVRTVQVQAPRYLLTP